jgi:hypothetical protein
MNLNITLSINKREETQHSAFLLRWNPATSSYTMANLDSDMSEWAEGYWSEDFDWSIHEWQGARRGDRFFMVRVGEGNTGIFAAGRFASAPFVDSDSEVRYVQLEFETVFHPERADIISTAQLERELPHLDWRGGNSGEMLTKESIDPSWSDMVVVEIPNGLDDMDAYGEGVVLVWLYAKPLSSGRKNVALMSRMEKTLNDIIRDNRDKTYHLSRRGTYTDYNTSINWHCNIVELILKVF